LEYRREMEGQEMLRKRVATIGGWVLLPRKGRSGREGRKARVTEEGGKGEREMRF
jgi:hypothetical protein